MLGVGGCAARRGVLFEDMFFLFVFGGDFMHFCPGTMTTHAESINANLQRGLDRRLRHTQH